MNSQREIELSLGKIHYCDEGAGKPILFIHGLLVDGTLWRKVVAQMPQDQFRCIVPDLPLGSHKTPMRPEVELSPSSVAHLVLELMEALELEDVTVVANDTGGAIAQLLIADAPESVNRLVLTPCDAFERFLPSVFRLLQYAARVPGLLTAYLQPLRIRALRRLPIAFGLLAKRPVPAAVTDGWLAPFLSNPGIRRDTVRFLRAIDSRDTLAAAERFRFFERPVLLPWAPEDRIFPFAEARRLAALFPDARLEEVHDSYGFVPEDQPELLASLVQEFVAADAGP